jgi:hypothetical protein
MKFSQFDFFTYIREMNNNSKLSVVIFLPYYDHGQEETLSWYRGWDLQATSGENIQIFTKINKIHKFSM